MIQQDGPFAQLYTMQKDGPNYQRPLRPGWFFRISLFLTGLFFLTVATISTWATLKAKGMIG